MKRRHFLLGTAFVALAAIALPASLVRAEGAPELKEIRIGYQKSGVLLVAKAQKLLEKRFEAKGIAVKWVEFSFGPPLLEALNSGSIDYGTTGDAPPVFAQAARANLYYVAAIPARGAGQAVIVPPDSPIKSLSELKGKNVGVAKASSAHNLLIAALESVGLSLKDVNVQYLAPADAAAAYTRGAIDAWSIWDPYFAIAELGRGARVLPVDPAASAQNSYFLANKAFTESYPDVVRGINEELDTATKWIAGNRDAAAQAFSEASGVDIIAQKKSVARAEYVFSPLTDTVIAQQQAVADRFFRLGLIPKQISVRDIVWQPKSAS